jgi:leucyl aminopeptidase
MTVLSLVSPADLLTADAVIIATIATPDGLALAAGAAPVDRALKGKLLAALKSLDASGRADEVIRIPTLGQADFPVVVATGLGKGEVKTLSPEAVRRAVGAAARSLGSVKRVGVAIGTGTDEAIVAAIADGIELGSYRFTKYKSNGKPSTLKRAEIAVSNPAHAAAKAELRRSKVITQAINNTRDLVNTPPNILNPVSFAEYAREQGQAAGLEVEVLDERALKRGSYGGLLAVGNGSATPPRLVRLAWRPARAKTKVALVGKGITFDTGGLDLKTAMMNQMKSDMSGAAAVIETVIAAAKLKLPVEVVATVPMAENAVGAGSYRPADVLTMHDGRTVEVDNTDAEGRIILADAILRAVEDNPDYLIEISTLTGGQMVALGRHTTGAMGSDEFRDRIVAIGTQAGESLWPMPLPDHLRSWLDSSVADITNLPKERWASMLVGGAFLREFIPAGLPWVHLDIAGPSFLDAPSGYNGKGGTGVMVRTLVAALGALAS